MFKLQGIVVEVQNKKDPMLGDAARFYFSPIRDPLQKAYLGGSIVQDNFPSFIKLAFVWAYNPISEVL